MLNPLLYKCADRIDVVLRRRHTLWAVLNRGDADRKESQPSSADQLQYHTVIVGYGPIGQTLARLLNQGGIQPVIVDMNIETVRRLQRIGGITAEAA